MAHHGNDLFVTTRDDRRQMFGPALECHALLRQIVAAVVHLSDIAGRMVHDLIDVQSWDAELCHETRCGATSIVGREMGNPEVFGILPDGSGQHSLGVRAIFFLVGASWKHIGAFARERLQLLEKFDGQEGKRYEVGRRRALPCFPM